MYLHGYNFYKARIFTFSDSIKVENAVILSLSFNGPQFDEEKKLWTMKFTRYHSQIDSLQLKLESSELVFPSTYWKKHARSCLLLKFIFSSNFINILYGIFGREYCIKMQLKCAG